MIKDCFTSRSKTKKWRNDYINKRLEPFRNYTAKDEMRLYVPTRFQEERPNMYDIQEKGENDTEPKELIPYFLEKIWIEDNPDRYYCVLAETGMGKTTFLVQLLIAYINKYNEKSLPFEIFILNLADKDIIEQINKLKIEDPQMKSILLLDALDENLDAYDKEDENGKIISSSYEDFRKKLEQAVEGFQFVVITCRTQFFPDKKSELQELKNARHIGQSPDKSLPRYKQLYISPFSDDDINKYIEKKFKNDVESKQKAKGIIDNIKSLAVRPLILSYIGDLMDREVNDELDAYEIIIDKWLQREVNGTAEDNRNRQKELLYDFSRKLAENIYKKWENTGALYLTQKEYDEFKKNQSFNELDFSVDNKSLITRDNRRNIIFFAHKSFLEYFCAELLFIGEIPNFRFEGMDMAKTFFELFCQNKEDKLNNLGNAEKARRYSNISRIYNIFNKDKDKAKEYREKSSEIFKEVLGRDYPTIPFSYNNIGNGYIDKLKSPHTLDFEEVMMYGFFWYNINLPRIEIAEGVTEIGDRAFEGCIGLTSIEIPNGVTKIGSFAFRGCIGLTSIKIPKGMTKIGDLAFYGCTSLASVIIDSDNIMIANSAFDGCTSLPNDVLDMISRYY